MVRGIGVDTASISEIARLISIEKSGKAFEQRFFTENERESASKRNDPAEYYATRFAAKEAVYKAIASLLVEKTFDLRLVEALNDTNGAPFIHINERFRHILQEACVNVLHISITTEGDFATAFVVACFENK